MLGLIPAVMIIQHACFLFFFRKKFTSNDRDHYRGHEFLRPAWEGARSQELKEFSPRVLLVRYGIPAILVSCLGITWFYLLCNPPELIAGKLAPMRLGLAGAYAYVLLTLGQRNFRRDITNGIAYWCGVTMAFGPLLAGVLASLGISTSDSSVAWDAVYFFAGFAPRPVTTFIEEAARRLLQSGSNSVAAAAPRTMPITQVRGVTPQFADRLGEEGIMDVYGFAMTNPNRLLRNTSFDTRQILDWIDESILIATFPNGWQKLEEIGITGAIDLAWYQLGSANDMESLAERAGIDHPILSAAIKRLFEDAQVQLIWALYQNNSDESQNHTEAAVERTAVQAT
jgi:hypothetical protein